MEQRLLFPALRGNQLRARSSSLREAISELSALKLIDDEAWAYAILARALLSDGEPGEAVKVMNSGAGIAAKTHIRIIHFAFAIGEARVLAATGRPAEAAERLRPTVAEAAKYGFVGFEFEARLVLGEVEMKSGNTAAGRALLATLEEEATAKGFLLIARKAQAAAGQATLNRFDQHCFSDCRRQKRGNVITFPL